VILRRLSDAILAADDERIRRRAERHADERAIAEHDRSQFLPSSLDADRVRDALTVVVAAQTGWEYLRGAVPPRDLLALLDTPAIARLGSGVVVPTTAADDAVACLEGGGIRTTSLVSVYTAVAADAIIAAARVDDAAEDAPAWTALRRGLVDQDEAAATVRFLKERAQASQREDAELAQRRAADQTLQDTVVAFLDDCPAGKLEAIDADITRWDAERRGVEQAQRAAQEQLRGLDEADRAADKASTETSKALRKADSTLDWLDELIPALRDEESLRKALSWEEERAASAGKRATGHADRQVAAAGEEKKHEAEARGAGRRGWPPPVRGCATRDWRVGRRRSRSRRAARHAPAERGKRPSRAGAAYRAISARRPRAEPDRAGGQGGRGDCTPLGRATTARAGSARHTRRPRAGAARPRHREGQDG
jgi:murein DD-endopeptidase MepM/ murein hydrolase activator NlpD